MKFGVSYWGSDVDVARDGMARISRAGFSWVVFPASTERMRYDAPGLARIIEIAIDHGIEPRVSPWGVGGAFGGEGVADGRKSPRDAVLEWTEAAVSVLSEGAIYWDEPIRDSTLNIISSPVIQGILRSTNLRQYLYHNPTYTPMAFPTEFLSGIGIDAYNDNRDSAVHLAATIRAREFLPVHVWVRSFGLGSDDYSRPARDILHLASLGIDEIAVWGFPSWGCSVLNNAAPHETWDNIETAVRNLAKGSS